MANYKVMNSENSSKISLEDLEKQKVYLFKQRLMLTSSGMQDTRYITGNIEANRMECTYSKRD